MSRVVLSGSIEFLTLGDVIQVIGPNGGTGILHIKSKYTPDLGQIFFDKGNVIHAVAGEKKGLQAAYALFGWTEGDFEFSEEEVTVTRTINENRMAVILDGTRMLDDGQIERLGPVSMESGIAGVQDGGPASGRQGSYPVIKGPLVDYMYVVGEDEFSEGQVIVEENRHGSWNWTILEGIVDVIKETNRGPVKIYRLGDGAFLGSIDSLSFQGRSRNATAVASSSVQLGVLDGQRLTNEYNTLSSPFKKMVKSLENRLREVSEKAVAIYTSEDNANEILKDVKLVIRQSSSELSQVYTIEEGEAYIVQHTDSGYLLLAHLMKGDFIGKLPFLDIGHEPLSASVFATKNFKVEKPNIQELKGEYDNLTPMLKSMLDNLATSIMVATHVAFDFQKMGVTESKKAKKASGKKRKKKG